MSTQSSLSETQVSWMLDDPMMRKILRTIKQRAETSAPSMSA